MLINYETAELEMTVDFPQGKRCCDNCSFSVYEIGLHRTKCFITNEIVAYSHAAIGQKCPLKFKEDDLI